jgi:hypothetical protein
MSEKVMGTTSRIYYRLPKSLKRFIALFTKFPDERGIGKRSAGL